MTDPDPRRTELRPQDDPEAEHEEDAGSEEFTEEHMHKGKDYPYHLEPIPEDGKYDPARIRTTTEGEGQGGYG